MHLSVFKNFYSGERIQELAKLWIRMPDSPDKCGRKPYPERISFGLKNIRVCVDGTKKKYLYIFISQGFVPLLLFDN